MDEVKVDGNENILSDEINSGVTNSSLNDNSQPSLTRREMKYLKKNRYMSIKDNPSYKSFIIFNKKNGQMVEIKAASSFHACKIIGSKPNQVKVISENTLKMITEAENKVENS